MEDVVSIYARTDEFGNIEVHVTKESAAVFRETIHRATNLWPDAPAEIKWMADIITSGKPMQDYFANPHLAGKGKPLNADKA
jgi:hypothetical protein